MADSTTTTTTLIPTTTTTTTTVSPLVVVKTRFYRKVNQVFEAIEETDGSIDKNTRNSPFAKSFSFGTIASGETSSNAILDLNVPNVKEIRNVKIALTNIGNMEFKPDTFGISFSNVLQDNVVPSTYFNGINTDGSDSNIYNVSVGSRNVNNSNYVYLNIKLPLDSFLDVNVIRYQWFFDYA
jgi:hypothetical protein